MGETPNTDREQSIITAQIRAGNCNKSVDEAGWNYAREAEKKMAFMVKKIEKLELKNFDLSETVRHYQTIKGRKAVNVIKQLEAQNAELVQALEKLTKTHKKCKCRGCKALKKARGE